MGRQWSPRSAATRPATSTSISATDRKSTRLNSSHTVNSYAVFGLKKKNCGQGAAVGVSIQSHWPESPSARIAFHVSMGGIGGVGQSMTVSLEHVQHRDPRAAKASV